MTEESMNQQPQEESQSQQPQDGGQPMRTPPDNYLVFAILATIFCCWPLGIPAIVFATQVNTKFTQGDIAGAEDASKKAKMWSLIALGAGIAAIVLYAGFMLLSILLSAAGNR